jgi:hypothetical protein
MSRVRSLLDSHSTRLDSFPTLIHLSLDPSIPLILRLLRFLLPPGLEIPTSAPLHSIIIILGVRFECNLCTTVCTSDIKSKDFDTQVGFLGIFFAGIEFLALVDVLAAGVAPHAEGGHETDRLLAVVAFAGAPARKLAWIEVRGIVLA